MKAHRFWTLSLIAALAACTSDNPTGLSHTDGVVINRVDDLAIYKFQQQMNTTSTLTCETISFDREFSGGPYVHGSVISGTNLQPMPFGVAVGVSVPIFDNTIATGEAWIYDTDTNGGEDLDLETGGQLVPLHNVLIMQSLETPQDPNDAAAAGTIKFTFPAGDWFIRSYTALDQEGQFGESIQLDADGNDVAITNVTLENDSDFEVVTVGVVNVGVPFNSMLAFNFAGSGAIDDLVVCEMITRGGEGCTPGYWKQSQHFDSWPGADTSIRFDEAFVNACNTYDAALQKPESGFLCDLTLLQALNLKGGGANALGRHAAAAWLNTQSVDFYYTQAEVEDMLEGALMTENYEGVKNDFAEANEAGCPLS